MLVSRIMPYSGISSNSKNKTNATSNVAFQARPPKRLPEDFVALANKVADRYKVLYEPISEAHWTLGRTKASEAEKEQALAIIRKGVFLEAPVMIADKKQICRAEIGQYCEGKELCLDIGNEGEKEARRYRITLPSFEYKATDTSKLTVQKTGQEGYFSDWVQVPHDEKLAMMKTLLEAFAE